MRPWLALAVALGCALACGCSAPYVAAGTVYVRPASAEEGLAIPMVTETHVEGHEPIAGATVRCTGCEEPQVVETDERGGFVLTLHDGDPAPDPVELEVEKDGFAPVRFVVQILDRAGQRIIEPIVVWLAPDR